MYSGLYSSPWSKTTRSTLPFSGMLTTLPFKSFQEVAHGMSSTFKLSKISKTLTLTRPNLFGSLLSSTTPTYVLFASTFAIKLYIKILIFW